MLCGDEEVEMKKGGRSDVHSKCGSPQYSAKSIDKLMIKKRTKSWSSNIPILHAAF